MENLLASYLYSFKNCPLPTVGVLIMQAGAAVAVQSDKIIQAATPNIQFVSKEINADELLQYISMQKNISLQEASDELSKYCSRLLELQPYEELPLASAGNFYITEEGALNFKYSILPTSFFPNVPAERVIHPDASHNMLVGDTQTNTTAMAQLLDGSDQNKGAKWVWVAAALALVGALVLTVYLMNRQPGSNFGNNARVNAEQAPAATFRSSK